MSLISRELKLLFTDPHSLRHADKALIEHARKLATQARDAAPHYQHSEIGYNYRMSNVLATIGRGQLQVFEERVLAPRRNFEFYQNTIGDLPGIDFMPEAPWGASTRWLTVITVAPPAPQVWGEEKPTSVSPQDWGAGGGAGGRGAKPSAWRWRMRTSNPGLCGNRCTCSRSSRTAKRWAAPWPRRSSAMAKPCPKYGRLLLAGRLPSGTAMTGADLARVAGVVRSLRR